LFFKNLTKKKIPENKKINIEFQLIVFGVLTIVKIIYLKKIINFFSLKKINSSTKLVSNEIDKKTQKQLINILKIHIDKYFINVCR
jgi:hypothetical protein